jgi:hypothetical protein
VKKLKAIGFLVTHIISSEKNLSEKPLLIVVDDEESDYPEIYD